MSIFSRDKADPTAVAVVKALGWGRVAVGLSGIVAPKAWSGWVGDVAAQPGGQVAIRSLGARDVLLGFLAVHVVERPGVGKRTTRAIAAMDGADLAGTLLAARGLKPSAVAGVGALAGGAALAALWAADRLPD